MIEFTPEMVVNSFVEICLDVNITDDSFGEPFECFFVVVESQNRRVIINDGLIKVTIQDNECECIYSTKSILIGASRDKINSNNNNYREFF